jgi:hypothetical protein
MTSTVLPVSTSAWSTSRSFLTSSKMKPRSWLVEDVEGAAGGAPRQFLGQFDALRLAARERRRWLADMSIVHPSRLMPSKCSTVSAGDQRRQSHGSSATRGRNGNGMICGFRPRSRAAQRRWRAWLAASDMLLTHDVYRIGPGGSCRAKPEWGAAAGNVPPDPVPLLLSLCAAAPWRRCGCCGGLCYGRAAQKPL